MASPGGTDLMGRLIANETMYIAEGVKGATTGQKALAMAKLEAMYKFRTGIQDIVASKPPKS